MKRKERDDRFTPISSAAVIRMESNDLTGIHRRSRKREREAAADRQREEGVSRAATVGC